MKENHIFFREYRAEARQKNIGTKEKVAVLTACGNVKREKCLFPTFGRRFFFIKSNKFVSIKKCHKLTKNEYRKEETEQEKEIVRKNFRSLAFIGNS